MSLETINPDLKRRVERAVGRLMSAQDLEGGKVMVSVPVTYPSGASVVVEIEKNAERIWVSDIAMGMTEAEMMGAGESYQRLARGKADEFGIGYDNRAMFVLWAPVDRIESAIICVANASAQAAASAVLHASEVQSRAHRDAVFHRVEKIFGQESVARKIEIPGRRSAWEAHNVVHIADGRRAIFEPMSTAPQSVSSKFLMFSDIKEGLREDQATVSLNVVVESLDALDAKAQIVSDVANIVELKAADDVFRRYSIAA